MKCDEFELWHGPNNYPKFNNNIKRINVRIFFNIIYFIIFNSSWMFFVGHAQCRKKKYSEVSWLTGWNIKFELLSSRTIT